VHGYGFIEPKRYAVVQNFYIANQIRSANCVNQSAPLLIGLVPTALLASLAPCRKPDLFGYTYCVESTTFGLNAKVSFKILLSVTMLWLDIKRSVS
jgi:hypothetical protein